MVQSEVFFSYIDNFVPFGVLPVMKIGKEFSYSISLYPLSSKYILWNVTPCLSGTSQTYHYRVIGIFHITIWWHHQMETFSPLLAICVGNSPITGEFPSQRPVTRDFDVLFDLRLNKRLSKQSRGWWFEMPSRPLSRHCNDIIWSCSKCRRRS